MAQTLSNSQIIVSLPQIGKSLSFISLSLSSVVQIVVEICTPTMGLWVVSFVDLGLWCMLIFGFVGLW